jgi:hypothetical protein
VPEKMLDARQLLRDVGASFRPLILKSFGLAAAGPSAAS